MCMTLSGHTSTLPRLVVQGHGFEASFLRWARLDFSPQRRRFLTEAMTLHCVGYRGRLLHNTGGCPQLQMIHIFFAKTKQSSYIDILEQRYRFRCCVYHASAAPCRLPRPGSCLRRATCSRASHTGTMRTSRRPPRCKAYAEYPQ